MRGTLPTMKYHYSDRFFTHLVRRGKSAASSLPRECRLGILERSGGVMEPRCWVWFALSASHVPVARDGSGRLCLPAKGGSARHDLLQGQYQVGSLTGAVHLSNDNAGVPRPAQRGQKPRVEQKGKCWLDPDFQYEYGLRKQGLSILLTLGVLSKRCQKSYHRDNWLVAAKRS